MSSAQAHDRQAIVPFQHQVARIAQPSMNRPLAAIQPPPPALRFVPSAPATEPQTRQRGRLRIAERRNGERDAVRDDYSFFSSFLTSAFTFSQKDSLGAFLHASPRATIIFSVPSMLTPALSGLPPWP
jgi:hypothetical protein